MRSYYFRLLWAFCSTAIWTRLSTCATAQFLIAPDKPSFLDDPKIDYKRRNELFRNTQADAISSRSVILSALREPGIGSLAILAPYDDKLLWIRTNLDVEFIAADVDDDEDGLIDDDSRILQIRLRGSEEQSEDLRKIVGAISRAYMRNVVYKDQHAKQTPVMRV